MCNCELCGECVKCISLNLFNNILTIIVVLMNGIYAAWGLFIPRSAGRVAWKDYAEKLEVYLDVVSYSDSILIPLKTVTMLLVKWCCCKCDKGAKKKDDDDDPIDMYGTQQNYCSTTVGSVSTFQLKGA